jgi:hypothetical protein
MADEMNINKYNAFMGTIVISIVYAAISLSILLFSYFTEIGRKFFTDSLKYFITTFVIGTIIIIIIMTILVIDWKPDENKGIKTKEITGVMSCPDYWKNKKEDDGVVDNKNTSLSYDTEANTPSFNLLSDTAIASGSGNGFYDDSQITDKNLYMNKCINDSSVIDDTKFPNKTVSGTTNKWGIDTSGGTVIDYNTYLTGSSLQEANEQKTFLKTMLQMSADDTGTTKVTNTTDLKCNQVYPEVLDQLDAQEYADNDFKGKSNKYRCEFAKVCNVPWTSAGC